MKHQRRQSIVMNIGLTRRTVCKQRKMRTCCSNMFTWRICCPPFLLI